MKCHKNVISVTKSWMARFNMFSGDDIILTFYRFWLLRFVMWVIDVTFYRSSTGFFTFNNIPRQIFELDWSQDFSSNLELENLTPWMSDCPKLGQVIVFYVLLVKFWLSSFDGQKSSFSHFYFMTLELISRFRVENF